MNDTRPLRAAVAGLLSFAAAEEQALLAATPFGEKGSPDRWAAVPLVAHNNQFKTQQAERITALRSGHVPPAFAEVDHASDEAAPVLAEAIAANPDLLVNAGRDPDLAGLREAGLVAALR